MFLQIEKQLISPIFYSQESTLAMKSWASMNLQLLPNSLVFCLLTSELLYRNEMLCVFIIVFVFFEGLFIDHSYNLVTSIVSSSLWSIVSDETVFRGSMGARYVFFIFGSLIVSLFDLLLLSIDKILEFDIFLLIFIDQMLYLIQTFSLFPQTLTSKLTVSQSIFSKVLRNIEPTKRPMSNYFPDVQ